MRTVDVELWYKNLKKSPLHLNKPLRFGIRRSDFENRFRGSFSDAWRDLFKNSSLRGVKNVTNYKNSILFRRCYLFLLFVSITLGIITVVMNSILISKAMETRFIIKELEENDLNRIMFPAVGICGQTIISREARDAYAQYLYSLGRNVTFSLEDIKSNLLDFGKILAKVEAKLSPGFMEYLVNVAQETNVSNIMLKLAPKCKSLLEQCFWRSRRVGCENLFSMRVTSIGYCCVFNSRYLKMDEKKVPYKVKVVGHNMGLSVAIRQDINDFLYVREASNDVQVMLFDGDEYPMATTGLQLYPAQFNSTVYFHLKAKIHYLSSELKHFEEDTLGCRYAEHSGGIDENSNTHCLVRCHAKAFVALCGCMHYTMPFIKNSFSCLLEHTGCLAKFREKFQTFYPGQVSHPALSEELADALDCITSDGCKLPCERRRYSAEVFNLPHGDTLHMRLPSQFKGLNFINKTIVHFYFKNQYAISSSVMEIYWNWYDIVFYIANKWIFLTSISLVNVAEVIYHGSIRWRYYYIRRRRTHNKL